MVKYANIQADVMPSYYFIYVVLLYYIEIKQRKIFTFVKLEPVNMCLINNFIT